MTHSWPLLFSGAGSYAVYGFYVVSGYVISKVLHERYFRIENGFRKFWINRFLRLYPTYFFSVVAGLSIAWLAPDITAAFRVGMSLPGSEDGLSRIAAAGFDADSAPVFYLTNLLMVGLHSPYLWSSPIYFSPNSWSTSVEIYFYLVLSLGVAATRARSRSFLYVGAFLLSAVMLAAIAERLGATSVFTEHFARKNWPIRVTYYSFFGWTFFFAAGAFFYHFGKIDVGVRTRAALFVLCLAIPFILLRDPVIWVVLRAFYGLLIGVTLCSFSDDRGSPTIRLLGDASYPMFLLHWPVFGFLGWLAGLERNTPQMLLASFVVTLLVSIALVVFVERPIEGLRNRFRR